MAKKFLKLNIVLVSILSLAFFALAGTAQAQTGHDLDINFSGQPMFDASNFLPGDTVSGWASILNASSSPKDVILWTTNTSNPVNGKGVKLGDALTMSITRQGDTVPMYSKTLTQFFADTEESNLFPFVLKNNLPGGSSETYDFKVYFDVSTGDDYQGATAGFDLNIGSWQERQNGTSSGITYFSTGGGGGTPLFELRIVNVKDENTGQNSSIISWDTDALASTQIIYSRQGQPHTLTNNPPYYGYASVYPLPEDLNFTYHHQVFLSGLTPCSAYYYRVVSHTQGKGDTVSRPEQSFTTACPQQQEQQGNENGFNNGQGSGLLARNPINPRVNGSSVGEENNEGPDQNGQGQQQQEQNQNNGKKTNFNLMANLASIWNDLGFNACWPNFPWWLFLLFAVYPILKGLDYWNSRRDRSIVFSLISLIPIIVAVWAYNNRHICLPWWLLLLFLIASILLWLFDRSKRFPQKQNNN